MFNLLLKYTLFHWLVRGVLIIIFNFKYCCLLLWCQQIFYFSFSAEMSLFIQPGISSLFIINFHITMPHLQLYINFLTAAEFLLWNRWQYESYWFSLFCKHLFFCITGKYSGFSSPNNPLYAADVSSTLERHVLLKRCTHRAFHWAVEINSVHTSLFVHDQF